VRTVDRLRRAVLGDPTYRVKVIEPYQMLGEIDDALRQALGTDVIGVGTRRSMFATDESAWKPFTLFDGTEVRVPHNFNTTLEPGTGDVLIYPEGDRSAPPSGRMPRGGYFFDAIIRQPPLDEDSLNPADNMEEFTLFSEADVAFYREKRRELERRADQGTILAVPGTAFGDIALVPAAFLKHPRGIRDIAEWYASLALRPDYIRAVFDRQCEIGLRNIEVLIEIFGDLIQAVVITGTDFGTQRGLFSSLDSYRSLFKPYHRAVNERIHARTRWKTFIHSCGSNWEILPDFIDAGFDIFNPVQCSAAHMDPRALKREFGRHIVFWGGGVDTQKTLAFGTPDAVYREVCERIDIFAPGGGFVFNAVHNVQWNVPVENVQAMFKALATARSRSAGPKECP
jgi:hypothetical protein